MKCRDFSWIFFDWIRLDKSDGKSEIFSVGSSNGVTLGLINIIVLGVTYYYKLGIELGSKEYELLGLYEGDVEGIPKDIMIGSNEGCVEWKSLGINDLE